MNVRASWRGLLLVTGVVWLGQAVSLPSPVRDAATLQWAAGFRMEFPFWHLVFTPFCSIADALTVLSLHEQLIFQATVLVCLFSLAGLVRGACLALAWLVFVAWGGLCPHPMARLIAENPNTLLIDFHSHSQYSHDGRPSFTPEANRLWHLRQGYNAAFITDHNLNDAARLAHDQSMRDWRQTGYRSLMGEEISLHKTHLVLLGNDTAVDHRPYDGDLSRIPVFIKDMHAHGWPVIASLPEYWFYHWGPGVQRFVDWGMDGFEIINSAPKALDFPIAKRRFIVNLCREHNLPMTGISDNHGYGYATAAWNAMTIPGWAQMDPNALQRAVLGVLRKRGFQSVQVLERAAFRPESLSGLYTSPVWILLEYWRGLTPIQRLIWALWLWGGWGAWLLLKRRRRRTGP